MKNNNKNIARSSRDNNSDPTSETFKRDFILISSKLDLL